MTSSYTNIITKVKEALENIFVKKADRSHISYGQVDSTSTSTAFTATVAGLTSLTDGATVMLRNGVITSAEGFTLNVNGLGAKPIYNSMADATRDTTIFNINYTMLFVYDSTRIDGGCWMCYRGYNSDKDTNTIGYQIRTNSSTYTATDKFVRYRLLLEVDDEHYMPVNTSTSTSGTASKSSAMNTREFKIGGRIIYYGTTAAVSANTQIAGIAYLWTQINLVLGYSFSNSSSGPSLTTGEAVYMIAKPSATNKGMAKLNTPYYTQSLPSTADGLIYIYLGQATDATHIELVLDHPIYEYYNGGIRLYRDYYDSSEIDTLLNSKSDTGHTHSQYSTFSGDYDDLTNKPSIPSASSTTPSADTTNGSVGSGTTWAKADHTHPKSSIYAESSHTHSEYVNPTIVDNLTTNDATKVLSAKQGKVLQDNKLEKTHSSYKGKNVVTNSSTGAIEFEDKYSHPSTHASSMITDSNTYNNIGNTANTLDNILSNINSKLGTLTTIDLVEVTTNKGTASASTMNKLYLVAESSSATNDNYEIFVTVRTGTSGNYSYAWEKIDTARIDLSGYLTTSNASSTYLSKTDASSTYVAKEAGKGLFSGSYSDLTNKPSYSATVTSSTTDSVKIGSININGSNVDIYATNTVYTHPTPSGLGGAKTSGLYKVAVDAQGHITGTTSVGASDLPSHTHNYSTFSGSYNDLTNKPTIPSKISDLTNDSDFIETSSTTGLIKNDGSIDTSTYAETGDVSTAITTHDSSMYSHQDIRTLLNQKEVSSNKVSSITSYTGSTTKYPNVQAIEDYAEPKKSPLAISQLSSLITSASNNDIITLDNDYVNGTSNQNIYIADKNITIIGNGHTIDSNNKLVSFILSNATVTIYDCNFINNTSTSSSSSLFKVAPATGTGTLSLNNCTFKDSSIKYYLISIESGSLNIRDCFFYNNAQTGSQYILYIKNSNLNIQNTIFENNTLKPVSITNTNTTSRSQVITECIFNDNVSAITESSSSESYKQVVLKNNYFIQAGDTVTGCINNNYLTSHQDITGKQDKSNIVTSWNATLSDEKYPSEKLVKNSLDNKSNTGHEHTFINGESGLPLVRDDIHEGMLYGLSDSLIFDYDYGSVLYYNKNGNGNEEYNEVATIGDIPTQTSQLTNNSGFLTSHQSLTPTRVYNCTSFNSSYIDTSSTNQLMLYKLGDNLYFLRYFIATKNLVYSTTEYNINSDSIPSDYRPSGDRTFYVGTNIAENARIVVKSTGKVTISATSNNKTIYTAGTLVYWW